jgi:ATP-binding cassette subfamily C protein
LTLSFNLSTTHRHLLAAADAHTHRCGAGGFRRQQDMTAQFRKLLWLLNAREKRNGAILMVMMLIGAFLEVLGVAAVPAFVSAVVQPERLRQLPFAAEFIDRLGLDSTADFVVWGSIMLAAIFAAKTAFLIANFHFQMRYVANRQISLARRLTSAYLHAPYTFHLQRNTAEIVRNVNREVTIIANQIIASVLELATRSVILLAVLAFLFVVEPWVTLYWIAFFGVVGGIGAWSLSNKLKRYGQLEQEEGRRFLQAVSQAFGGIKEVKVLQREGYFAGQVDRAVRSIARVHRFRQFATKVIGPVVEFVAVAGLLVLVAWLVLAGTPTGAILVTMSLFVIGLVRLREALTTGMSHLASLRYHLVSIDPVHADLQAFERQAGAVRRSAPPPAPKGFAREVELRHVWYRYDHAGDHALKDISVTIPRGAAVGFVGSTGAGKSTLVDTILALLEPERGGVFVDGRDIREGGVAAWQRNIGYVPQAIYLLDDSIRSNIAMGIPEHEIDDVALRRAIAAAQLERLIESQPQGLDTRVGERGVRLSGGERQRIGIARALYHDPEILVFDEATSSLDNSTERAVISALEALKGERTIIMIAHRLSTVQNCDTLHFLKHGRIEASGSFAELQRRHPDFRVMTETG